MEIVKIKIKKTATVKNFNFSFISTLDLLLELYNGTGIGF